MFQVVEESCGYKMQSIQSKIKENLCYLLLPLLCCSLLLFRFWITAKIKRNKIMLVSYGSKLLLQTKNIFKVEFKQFKNKFFKYCSLTKYSKQIVVFNY